LHTRFFEAETNVVFPFYTSLEFTAISLPTTIAAAIFCQNSGRPSPLPELNEASEEILNLFPQPLLLVKYFMIYLRIYLFIQVTCAITSNVSSRNFPFRYLRYNLRLSVGAVG
jgi:hypothetical protein